ncbi:DUF922 domain-containing protein [Christiangramia sp. OXR-203]|uniref:DUF922 domain-containing protein n=1 Tax=Christiangramia sp. OXR-203 TaxID=3100176 RepID=UPI002AC90B5C|nr:DUF922 domain-containing protein [Christiangramia sp. OXR-203]WPY99540.1 DUF922 domain-containing protein [Christiangramia sp. OXR-203]
MRKFLLALFLFGIVQIGCSQEKRKIEWASIDRLSWQNFEASPDYSIDFSANTNSGMSYSWNYSTRTGKPELTHEVKSNFYPDLSWVKDVNNPAYLLAHEQLHFDITELHARKLRKRLAEYEIGRRIRQDLKRLYNITEAERVAMQNRFDKETSHSENKEAEYHWRKFVASQLAEYEVYAL